MHNVLNPAFVVHLFTINEHNVDNILTYVVDILASAITNDH